MQRHGGHLTCWTRVLVWREGPRSQTAPFRPGPSQNCPWTLLGQGAVAAGCQHLLTKRLLTQRLLSKRMMTQPRVGQPQAADPGSGGQSGVQPSAVQHEGCTRRIREIWRSVQGKVRLGREGGLGAERLLPQGVA